MPSFVERAPAKINLTLRVLGRRPDGYHEIESLVAFAGDGDVLTLETGTEPGVVTTGRFAQALSGPNLVATALERLAACEPRLRLGKVILDKRLPVAAGLGGGSADAAAILRAVRRANPDLAPAVDWHAIAMGLGADVPVCLAARPAIMRGTGERISAVPTLPPLDVVLVNPLMPVPADKTRQVFRALNASPLSGVEQDESAIASLPATQAELIALMKRCGNDLLAPARQVVPATAAVISALEASTGVEHVQMAGAGPTCFGVYPCARDAEAACEVILQDNPGWWANATVVA